MLINRVFKSTWSVIIYTNTQWRKIPLDYSYAGHWTSRNTPGCICLCYGHFLSQKTTPDAFHTPIHTPDIITTKWCHLVWDTPPSTLCQILKQIGLMVPRYSHFCITPLLKFFPIWPLSALRHGLRSNTTTTHHPVCPATADAIASALTARTASISLPIYDWNSKMHTTPFSIFCHTLENWLLLNHILPDSKDHLRYVFAALGTKSLEMHAQWMPTGSEEEQKATKAKASASSTISNREWHTMSILMCALDNWKILWPGWERTPKISLHASRHWWTNAEMINDEHCKHELCHRIVHAYCHEGKLLGKLMAKPFKTPSNELADIAVNHFAIQHAREQVSHRSKPVDTFCQDKGQTAHTSHSSHGHTPSAPSKDCPNCTKQHPAGKSKLPAHDSHCSKCDQDGTLGTQMPWWQATPTKECTSMWVTAEEV